MDEQVVQLKQIKRADRRYRVNIATKGFTGQQEVNGREFEFFLSARDQEDIRWYLEDYLLHPFDPAPASAERIEALMESLGHQLFRGVFQSGDALEFWGRLKHKLDETRVEVLTEAAEATTVPWELMKDPESGLIPALSCRAFVRASYQPIQSRKEPKIESGPIRILLAICRPGKSQDVPFRSVASRLIRGLTEDEKKAFQLDVLRPATFESLKKQLTIANDNGKPYHVLHFDGHGDFLDVEALLMHINNKDKDEIPEEISSGLLIGKEKFNAATIHPDTPAKGNHGYLFFETPKNKLNMELVGGKALGQLLHDTNVPVLVLNACRSAHAEPPEKPEEVSEGETTDIHSQIRAYGSLAQELVDRGVAGVVAMRHSVFVYTAAEFMANLYSELSRGRTLGEAVTRGRKHLKDNPLRTIAYEDMRLQDWCVPQVYESLPIRLFPSHTEDGGHYIDLRTGGASKSEVPFGKDALPKTDYDFVGRDETLLALDRAFDTQSIVMLQAYAGSGKTATAIEFAKWYTMTGGVKGLVLFSKFEHKLTLSGVLSHFGEVFGPSLQASGINWTAITDEESRRQLALQVLEQVPVLWIWDNIEPVMGFPRGEESEWSGEEQKELRQFLVEASKTRAKFLLTSRRDEEEWLKDLPFRITVPPMPMQERLELARTLAVHKGKQLPEIADWRPLLRFTEGNPLTITVIVGQALRDGIEEKEQIEAFVEKLQAGEAEFDDDEKEGRDRSLGASLRYGFEKAFNEDEKKVIAILYLFQGFVDVSVLSVMGNEKAEEHLSELKGLNREKGIELLDRTAEIGLVTAYSGGYYSIHPAVPWFLKSLFSLCYPNEAGSGSTSEQAIRSFIFAVGALGDYYHRQYNEGNRNVIHTLIAEETNLLHARKFAIENRMFDCVISVMQGLYEIYDYLGRWSNWREQVNEILPYFVDPETDGPIVGQEDSWSLVTGYRIRLARNDHDLKEAERLLRIRVEYDRKLAAKLLELPVEQLTDHQKHHIRTLSVTLHELGGIQRESGLGECVQSYKESLQIDERIGNQHDAAISAYNLGVAFAQIPSIFDFDKAELHLKRSLELHSRNDNIGRARCLCALGAVALQRFRESRKARQSRDELLKHLDNSLNYYNDALRLFPPTSPNDLAVTHNQLGNIYFEAKDLSKARFHFEKSISYEEVQGNVFGAAKTRFNLSVMFYQAGQFSDALLYAKAALKNYESYGDRAVQEIDDTKRLIARIEKAIAEQKKENKE